MTPRFTFRRFTHDARGSTTVEYAMVLPVLLWLTAGTMEFGLYYYSTSVLEGAVNLSSRLGRTGYTEEEDTGVSREDMIIEMLREESFALMDPDQLQIETQVYNDLSAIDEPEEFVDANGNDTYDLGETFDDVNGNGQRDSDMGAAGLGNAGDIVVYTAIYPWEIKTPFLTHLFGNGDGSLPIRSSVVVKNEPWENVVYGGS